MMSKSEPLLKLKLRFHAIFGIFRYFDKPLSPHFLLTKEFSNATSNN